AGLEPAHVPGQDLAAASRPACAPEHLLDPERGESWGNVVTQDMYFRHRRAIGEAMARVPALAVQADQEWRERTGRGWGILERYRCDGARTVLVTMGSMCGTAREAVDRRRGGGRRASGWPSAGAPCPPVRGRPRGVKRSPAPRTSSSSTAISRPARA